MSTMKDKLANSVRQAKSGAQAGTEPIQKTARAPAVSAAPAKTSKPAAQRALPTTATPAPVVTVDRASASAQNPTPSAQELFPRRVWPD